MMQSNLEKPKRPISSIEILKAHMGDLPVRNLDTDWIKENKVNLDSLMKDRHPRI